MAKHYKDNEQDFILIQRRLLEEIKLETNSKTILEKIASILLLSHTQNTQAIKNTGKIDKEQEKILKEVENQFNAKYEKNSYFHDFQLKHYQEIRQFFYGLRGYTKGDISPYESGNISWMNELYKKPNAFLKHCDNNINKIENNLRNNIENQNKIELMQEFTEFMWDIFPEKRGHDIFSILKAKVSKLYHEIDEQKNMLQYDPENHYQEMKSAVSLFIEQIKNNKTLTFKYGLDLLNPSNAKKINKLENFLDLLEKFVSCKPNEMPHIKEQLAESRESIVKPDQEDNKTFRQDNY